ncbi:MULTISPECIES: DUF2884 family protein [Dyella]|uniref:DUF2884 family protein n=2 Tax=Dyella TaxID=231454 RepID=A0A4R0YI99_9GAMM|nr:MULTISPECIES: DUF2884 family protein [Dyella]TBR36800.1 DUF2884 family protein [Dyella terrae]TCI08109.1 DUF2884 family protein [Dyella soli]
MRMKLTVLALAAGLSFGATAQAKDVHINDGTCGYTTNYDVRVNSNGVFFDNKDAKPASVYMHDGKLVVDGKSIAVTDDDAQRLRNYENGVRQMLPEVTVIAREGVDIGFTAMRTVLATFSENEGDRRKYTSKLEASRNKALTEIDNTLAKGVWNRESFGDAMGEAMGSTIADLASTVAANAVAAALTGDQSKVAALEARANSLDKSVNKEIEARADKLSVRADALCPRIEAMAQTQQQFQFRLSDGSRLQLITYNKDNDYRHSTEGKPAKVASR